jgi:flagellar motor switch protein FliN
VYWPIGVSADKTLAAGCVGAMGVASASVLGMQRARMPEEVNETPQVDEAKAEASPAEASSATAVAEPPISKDDGSAKPFPLPDFGDGSTGEMPAGISLLADVNLNVKIELGRTRMLVENVLRLVEGSVVELDKLAGDPVDVFVNDRHVARGEVLVLNDNFCVRISEIIAPLAATSGGEATAA